MTGQHIEQGAGRSMAGALRRWFATRRALLRELAEANEEIFDLREQIVRGRLDLGEAHARIGTLKDMLDDGRAEQAVQQTSPAALLARIEALQSDNTRLLATIRSAGREEQLRLADTNRQLEQRLATLQEANMRMDRR